MSKRRAGTVSGSSRQANFGWQDPSRLLEAVGGEVVYEAPDLSRLTRSRQRPSRVRVAPAAAREILSLGLPFGVRKTDSGTVCWSCSRELADKDIIRTGPGYARCPGCGAKLPFAE
jgi:hypothetical protein